MKEHPKSAHPILFTGPMVLAILNGTKTMTRRIKYKCEPGDMLWVRETWKPTSGKTDLKGTYIRYRSDDSRRDVVHNLGGSYCDVWRPSIFMYRWASRITLEVISVREERLQQISRADAIAEGIVTNFADEVVAYKDLWDSINKKTFPWSSNPLVKVIEFKRVEGEA